MLNGRGGGIGVGVRYHRQMIAAKRLGRYRVGERIGTGGVADVFVAQAEASEGFGKKVVLKCLRPHVTDLPEVVQSLIEEAQLARRLQHGNIVQVLDFEIDDGVPFVVMELVDGCTLAALLKDLQRRGEALPLDAVLAVAERVAAALDYAHRLVDDEGIPMKVVHRDVKPSNILLSRDGLVKLADFGVAKVARRDRETLPGVLKGTPSYWAPEQAAGDPVDARADVYGLGVVLGQLLPVSLTDPELTEIVAACVAEAPADRLPTMRALIDQLRDWGARNKVHPRGETIATLVRRAKRDQPVAARVALDSALRSTTKRDATQQHRAGAVVATGGPWTRAAMAAGGAIAAVVVIWAVMGGVLSEHDSTVAGPPARISAAEHAVASTLDSAVPDLPPPTAPPDVVRSATPAEDHAASDGPDSRSQSSVPPTPAPRPVKVRKGLIKVNTLPWAEVEIDGKAYGRVPIEASLRTGRHRVVLHNPTVGRKQTTVTIVAGEAVSVTRWPN